MAQGDSRSPTPTTLEAILNCTAWSALLAWSQGVCRKAVAELEQLRAGQQQGQGE